MDRTLDVRSRQRLAVLIDAENVSSRIADELFRRIEAIGESITRRVYGDFRNGQGKGWLEVQHRHRLLPQQISPQAAGKNGSDIGLVIDAMDLLHGGQVEGICIVSSDSDFSRLALRAREHGLAVYGFGEQKTPESFRMACTSFSLVEGMAPLPVAANVVPINKPAEAKPASKPKAAGATASPPVKSRAIAPQPEPQAAPIALIRAAIEELSVEGGWVSLSQLGSALRRKQPGFTAKAYGSATLGKLLGKLAGLEVGPAGAATADQVRLKPR